MLSEEREDGERDDEPAVADLDPDVLSGFKACGVESPSGEPEPWVQGRLLLRAERKPLVSLRLLDGGVVLGVSAT